jgi:hypothetical protein
MYLLKIFLPVLVMNSWYLKYSVVRNGLFADRSIYDKGKCIPVQAVEALRVARG